jgi:hypothetical protein
LCHSNRYKDIYYSEQIFENIGDEKVIKRIEAASTLLKSVNYLSKETSKNFKDGRSTSNEYYTIQ